MCLCRISYLYRSLKAPPAKREENNMVSMKGWLYRQVGQQCSLSRSPKNNQENPSYF